MVPEFPIVGSLAEGNCWAVVEKLLYMVNLRSILHTDLSRGVLCLQIHMKHK